MENIIANKNWNKGEPLDDPTLRLSSRPRPTCSKLLTKLPNTPRRRGVAHEDFGASFGKVPKSSSASKPDSHPRTTSQLADTSIDELDTLTHRPPGLPTKNDQVDVVGEDNMSHVALLQRPSILPQLKFRKNKGSSKEPHRDITILESRPKPRPMYAQNSSPHRLRSPCSSTRQRTVHGQNVFPVAKKGLAPAKDLTSPEPLPYKAKLADYNSSVPLKLSRVSTDTAMLSSESQDSPAKTHARKSKAATAKPATFPLLSPLNKGKDKAKAKTRKSKQRVVSSDVAEDGDGGSSSSAPKAQPFPMSTQILDSIGSSPVAEPLNFDRTSPPGRQTRSKGKTRNESGSSRPGSEYEEHTFSLAVDPRTLCPYCDAPLPLFPTRLLEQLLASTKRKSHPEPRPGNSLGRSAPFSVFIAVCQRHRFECEILPEAERQGWPRSIDWDQLRKRVHRMTGSLRAIIDDAHMNDDGGKGPRGRSVFWKEVMAEVKKKGLRAAAGLTGQMANFEKTQPGYYGEMGSAVIHQILYDLLPPTSVDPDLVAPLTATEFIQRVLVPEVGLRLIMEDMNLDESKSEDGIRILRESTNYGVAMFPADEREEGESQNLGKANVADRIVMERARKRRKELEADENEEEEIMKELIVEAKQKAPKRLPQPQVRRARPRPTSKCSDISDDESSSVSSMSGRGTSDRLPRAIRKLGSTIEIEATPCKWKEKASAEIVITSSEGSAGEWDTGRMGQGRKKCIDWMPANALTGYDLPSLPLGTARRPDWRRNPRSDLEITPKPRTRLEPFPMETSPLLEAQKTAKRVKGDKSGASSDKGSSWLLSDQTDSSEEPA